LGGGKSESAILFPHFNVVVKAIKDEEEGGKALNCQFGSIPFLRSTFVCGEENTHWLFLSLACVKGKDEEACANEA